MIRNSKHYSLALLLGLSAAAVGCGGEEELVVHDPATAERVEVDRFSDSAGTLFVRTADNGLPGPNQPIDMDQEPFITRGLGPNGELIRYYNLDVQPLQPAPIYALFREGEDTPVAGQLNIVNVIPGSPGYSDFWNVMKVTVPADYVANTVVSVADIEAEGYSIEPTDIIVNCPIVPAGSRATLRGGGEAAALHQGWYGGMIVHYFTFEEAPITLNSSGQVPIAPIYVSFNKNPDDADPTSGPPSGFVTEGTTDQTHNVVSVLPSDGDYSPLWSVQVYDNQSFDMVSDLATAQDQSQVTILANNVASVNCPVVEIQQ
ncbi:hypothetical protein [Haliangium sp.]|uniref:hypothetical protein n=1 Tax=Haliangium sp. TaxID=2663208 RepID=UPI003D12D099